MTSRVSDSVSVRFLSSFSFGCFPSVLVVVLLLLFLSLLLVDNRDQCNGLSVSTLKDHSGIVLSCIHDSVHGLQYDL